MQEFPALKKPFNHTFSGQTTHFLRKNHKTRTYNLYHRKVWSDAVILSLRVGVQRKQIEENFFSMRWQ